MNVRKITETDTTITLGWDSVPNARGFMGTLDGSDLLADGKRHYSFDPLLSQIKMAKKLDGNNHSYGVIALGSLGSGAVVSPEIPTSNINTWEYTRSWNTDQWKPGVSWNLVTATSYSDTMSKFAALKAGDWLRAAFDFDGYLSFRNKDLTGGYVERISSGNGGYVRTPQIKAVVELVGNFRNSQKSLYKNMGWMNIGGVAFVLTHADIQSPQTEGGADLNDCWDFGLFDFKCHNTGSGGLLVQNQKQTMSRLLIQNECYDAGYRVQEIDPHNDKGSGLHSLNIGDNPSSVWNLPVYDSRVASFGHDHKFIEGGHELTNMVNCELWLKTENLNWRSGQDGVHYQDGGQTAVVWGYTYPVGPSRFQNNIFRYLEGNNQAGPVLEASFMGGTTPQCFGNIVEYARGHNTNQDPHQSVKVAYDPNFVKLAGGTYKDVA